MHRDPRQYADAARLLWDLPPERLSSLASGERAATQGVRDAAQMALGVKREYLSPEEFGSEAAALDRLAASLAMLPDFSLQEIAMASGHGPITSPPRTAADVVTRPTRSRHTFLRVVLVALILVVALEALAQAGVRIVSPISVIVDQLEPTPDEAPEDLRSLVDPDAAPSRYETWALSAPARPVTRTSTKSRDGAKTKNPNHAKGRLAHQAQGRERHQARGRDEDRRSPSQRKKANESQLDRVVRYVEREARVRSRAQVGRNRGGGRRSK